MRANRALIVCQGTDCFNQIQNARLDVGQALRDTQSRPVHIAFSLRKMTRITYLHGSPSETEPIRLCRRKAMEYQRTALTTTDPTVRRKYLHLLVKRPFELLCAFNKRGSRQRALSRFAPPFDSGFGQPCLREVMREQLRLGCSGGGKLIAQNFSPMRRCKAWRRLLSKFS